MTKKKVTEKVNKRICPKCKGVKSLTAQICLKCRKKGLAPDGNYYQRHWPSVRQARKEARRTERTTLREETLSVYSFDRIVCARCGYDEDIRALDLDHIKEKSAYPKNQRVRGQLYKRLKAAGYPEGFQVLCRNCNWLKYRDSVEEAELIK